MSNRAARALGRWLLEPAGDERDIAGPRIEGYVLQEAVGSGASSVVYRGLRVGSGRRLAVKVFRRVLAVPGSSRLALAEAERLEQVRLPCLPEVADFGVTSGGRFFIATSYVEGAHVTAWSDDRGLDLRDRVGLLARVCDAVADLHERGVIHRDLKPANILINEHGDCVLVDLGIAALAGLGEGDRNGTPGYAAPEQWRGEAATTRVDVYSLSAVGRDLLRSGLCSGLPRSLRAVLEKGGAADPERRYTSARELGDDLRRWLRRDVVEALPASPVRNVLRWTRRHPIWTTAVVCGLMLGLSSVGAYALVELLLLSPVGVRYNPLADVAHIVSRADRPIRTFHNVVYAGDVRVRGGVFFVMGGVAGSGPSHGLYDADRPGSPVVPLRTDLRQPVRPRSLPDRTDAVFTIRIAFGADLFGDSDEEIIYILDGADHATGAVVIMDIEGRVRFSLWHYGHIHDVLWVPKIGTLFIAGVNSETANSGNSETDDPNLNEHICFAVRPHDGGRGWIGMSSSSGIEPEWYSRLRPLSGAADKLVVAKFSIAPDRRSVYLALRPDGWDRAEAEDPNSDLARAKLEFEFNERGWTGHFRSSGTYSALSSSEIAPSGRHLDWILTYGKENSRPWPAPGK